MLSFASDYLEGAHPAILDAFVKTNMDQLTGYGRDSICDSAKEKIRKTIGKAEAEIYFISGGTQTNAVVIGAYLKAYQAVVAAQTGHVACHEAGAIEFSGHKVITLPQYLGKIKAADLLEHLKTYYADDSYDHMPFPGMVYLSHPTEYGTLYTKQELEEIAQVCHAYDMKLYLDGARLGYGLMSNQTDLTIQEIADICDCFYIGGTKVGALCGEAVVFPKGDAPAHFFTTIKQRGALLAKGRVLGVQFDTLFTDDLYFKISKNAIDQAEKLKKIFAEKGYEFYIDSPTNQQFIVLENGFMEELKQKVAFGFWEKYDDSHTVVRFATSWATTDEAIEKLAELV